MKTITLSQTILFLALGAVLSAAGLSFDNWEYWAIIVLAILIDQNA